MTRTFLLSREGAKREEILRRFLGELTPDQIVSYGVEKDKLFQAHAGEVGLVPGFAEFLLQLDSAALPSAVATSGSRSRVEQTLETLNLRKRFRAVVTGRMSSRANLIRLYFCWQLKPCKLTQVESWYAKML